MEKHTLKVFNKKDKVNVTDLPHFITNLISKRAYLSFIQSEYSESYCSLKDEMRRNLARQSIEYRIYDRSAEKA